MSWFPIAQDLMEHEAFRALPPTTRIYYLWCVSEFNLHGPFYRSDLEVGVTLWAAEVTIRKARRALTALGWLAVRPGTRAGGRHLATRYDGVKWSTTRECTWFAQQQRLAFEMMLHLIRLRTFQPADVWVYLCLSYLRWRYRSVVDENTFTVSKRVLAEMSGVHDAGERVRRLHDGFQYSGGSPLFDAQGYQQLTITRWSLPGDLDKEGNAENRQIVEEWASMVKNMARWMNEHDMASPRQYSRWCRQPEGTAKA
jgi:hypothetical protein